MSGCGCEMTARNERERTTLKWLLVINGLMFVAELWLGIIAQSTALIADSLDMLADAMVYALSLYAVGKGVALQVRSARLSGWLQIALAMMVLFEVVRRFLQGSEPVSALMMGVGLVALVANVFCLWLIAQHRDGGVHMRASLIFSANDVIANLGVILAGALVWWLGSPYPDLVIGFIIAMVVLRGGLIILREAAREQSCSSQS